MSSKIHCKDHDDVAVDTVEEYLSHLNLYHDQTTGAANRPWPEPFETPDPTDADRPFTTDLGEFPL